MTHNEELTKYKTRFIISSVAFLFCLIWALVGEADIKIVAVTLTFSCFLFNGIKLEQSAISAGGSH